MRSLRLAAVVIAGALAVPTVASAGTYVGLGVGPSPTIDAQNLTLDGYGRTGRFFLGYRILQFSVEGALTAASTAGNVTTSSSASDLDARYASIMGKYSHPLGNGFELFGKLGLQYSDYSVKDGTSDLKGSGLALAGGVEYHVFLGVGSIGLALEYGLSSATLQDNVSNAETKVDTRQWMLSVSVGL
ncbi:hypothetical protein BH11MYX2_BH11MYX2_14320 [soil metagenome]